MWSDEQVNDAIQVLWNASEKGDIEKVTVKDEKTKEIERYIVANEVTYTDPLYLKALDKLLEEAKFEQADKESDRIIFKRAGEFATAQVESESLKAI